MHAIKNHFLIIIFSAFVCVAQGYHETCQLDLTQFGDLCMEVWTQSDLVKGISIDAKSKSEILDQIFKKLTQACVIFNHIYDSSGTSKSKLSEHLPIENIQESLELIKESIEETFGTAHSIIYTTTINLLDVLLEKIAQKKSDAII